jgi:hypothetical protein
VFGSPETGLYPRKFFANSVADARYARDCSCTPTTSRKAHASENNG